MSLPVSEQRSEESLCCLDETAAYLLEDKPPEEGETKK